MKELGERNYTLITPCIRAEGTFDPNELFFMFEEQLYMDEADTIWDFLEWCHRENKSAENTDVYELFKEFINE